MRRIILVVVAALLVYQFISRGLAAIYGEDCGPATKVWWGSVQMCRLHITL